MTKLTTERLEKRIKNCIEVGNGCVMLPVSVAEELLAYRKTVNHLLDNDGSRGKFSAVQSYDAREGLERLLAPTAQQNEPQNIPENIPAQPDREQIRRLHAEWSDATFGSVGPVGPLKHLSKEALEAAADPDDLLEWADMQFLLWDAQRRMGIPDDFITIAMAEKLEINKKRQWPEPKDGEPRLHINTQSPQPVSEPYKSAANDIIAERQRQISAEGWTLEHDDVHTDFQLALAAACYAQNVADYAAEYYQPHSSIDWTDAPEPETWPWCLDWWKPTNPRRDLVKAGALILAEIERLDRASTAQESE